MSSSEEHKTFDKEASRWVSRAATGRGVGLACCGDSTSTGGARSSNRNRLHQTCGPVNQQRHVCVEKCQLTMRHVANRSGDSCGESQQRFGGIMTRRAGRTVTGGDAGGAGQSSKPTSTATSQSSRALEKCAKENTWVSTWTGDQLVETRARVKRRRRAMECHGGRLMECHDNRKRRTRESNVALQDLEKTRLSARAARGRESQ